MARERAERSLEEAQITIRDLWTKLAPLRAATAEQAVQETLQSVQAELVAEVLARRNTEDALAEAQEGRLEAEGRLREAVIAQQALKLSSRSQGLAYATTIGKKASAGRDIDGDQHAIDTTRATVPARKKKTIGPAMADGGARTIQARRRGRPAKAGDHESAIVEWWKPRSVSTGGVGTAGTLTKRGRGRPKGSKNRQKL